jgi:uncharacterized protein (DUF2141 family)
MTAINPDPAACSGSLRRLSGILALGVLAGVAPADAAILQVTVTGVRNSTGLLDLCVFDTEQDFPDCSGGRAVTSRRQAASAGTMRFDFSVAPGLHAVSVLHDENGNGRLDTNFLGMPREGGGASNNPPARFGPPRFAEAVFRLSPQGGQIVINMVYP